MLMYCSNLFQHVAPFVCLAPLLRAHVHGTHAFSIAHSRYQNDMKGRLACQAPVHELCFATGAVGLYLALTGSRLKSPKDLLYAGLGTHYVPSAQLPALRASLGKPLERQSDKQQGLEQILTRLEPHTEQVQTPRSPCL